MKTEKENATNSFNFKDLCVFFEEIKQIIGPREKYKHVCESFNQMRQSGEPMFSIIRLMVPKLDRDRDSFNMKEAKVARIIIKMLDLPPGTDKNVLSKSYLMAGQATDFGDVVYSVIRKYIPNFKTTLSIEELNVQLDNLTKRSNEKEAEDILMGIFKKCSSEHIRWIIRIILKDLKLGIANNSILNCYHKDGMAYYATNNSLRKVCEVLSDDTVKLHELEIQIFEAFRPMLSKRIDATNFKREFPENKKFYVEKKFDGERFQIHINDNQFKYFSRNGFDYTDNLGSSFEAGIFTPKLKNIINNNVQRLIIDGELMLWDKRTKTFGSKGMTLDVKKLNLNGPYQPCFCVYDIILLNDDILTSRPLRERVELLKTIFSELKPGVIILSEIKEVQSRQEIINELNKAVVNEEEGIILKNPDSIYKYSDRNSGWYKMKLEYFQDTMNDLDLIVMGGFYASSTSTTLNSFMVGIRSGTAENGKPLYLALGKVSTGLNNEELGIINKRIKTKGVQFEFFQSENLIFGKEKPDYCIAPEFSLIFEVRATELVRTNDNSFKTPYTLRFPRIQTLREDKPVDECLSINELLELTKNNKFVIKLNKRHLDMDDVINTKVRKVQKREIQMPTILDNRKVSDILAGYTIYVLNGTAECNKEKWENLVQKAGGIVSYRLNNEKVNIALVGIYVEKIKEIVAKINKFDVVNVSWLQRVLQDGNLLSYEPEEVYGLGVDYKNILSDELDFYGDSFTKETTEEGLKKTFETIKTNKEFCNLNNVFGYKKHTKNFIGLIAYFDKLNVPDDINSEIFNQKCILDALEFRYCKGEVNETINNKVNTIIYYKEDRRQFLEEHLTNIGRTDITLMRNTIIYE